MEKTRVLKSKEVFSAKETPEVDGDFSIIIYEDGAILFSGASILTNRQFTKVIKDMREQLVAWREEARSGS
jgi:hypothetical protein